MQVYDKISVWKPEKTLFYQIIESDFESRPTTFSDNILFNSDYPYKLNNDHKAIFVTQQRLGGCHPGVANHLTRFSKH